MGKTVFLSDATLRRRVLLWLQR